MPADEELRRVKPVITELVKAGVAVSVDTMRAQVAEWALGAGVSLVNDVSGGLADPYMSRLVAKAGIPYVVVHWRAHSHDMYSRASYADVVREVHDELAQRIDAVTAEGVDPSLIVLDPGLGFSKNPAARGPEAHNWQLLAGLPELATIGGRDFPVLVGASRKRYLSRLFDVEGASRGRSLRTTRRQPPSPRWPPRSARGASGSTRSPRTRTRSGWPPPTARRPGHDGPLMTGRPAERKVVLALGSNLGDRGDTLQGGVDAIAELAEVRLIAVSPVYETVPVGGPPQPDYLNAVVLADVTIPSLDLLDRLHEIEAEFDRVRVVRWGPRTLDIDIITVAGEHSDDPDLTLPHPRAHERAFVPAPWHDIDPAAELPGYGPVADLLGGLDATGIRRSKVTLDLPPGAS